MKFDWPLFFIVFLACLAAGVVLWLLIRAGRGCQERQAALAWAGRRQIGFKKPCSAAA